MKYAGFWRRFGAFWIDFACLLPLGMLTLWLGRQSRLAHLYLFAPNIFIGLWFNVHLVKQYGGTPGKLLLKTRIAKVDGSPVGYREAILRHSVLFVLTTMISVALISATFDISDAEYFSLDFSARSARVIALTPFWYRSVDTFLQLWIWSEFIVMLANERRRALHDFLAGTVVIRT